MFKAVRNTLLGAAVVLFSQTLSAAEEVIEKSFDVKKGGNLVVESSHGAIRVETWKQNKVQVEVKKKARRKEYLEDFKLDISQSGDSVLVEADGGWHSRVRVNYTISIPDHFNVDLKTGGGPISVGDLVGNVEADTSGGSIRVGNVDGDVKVDTSGGSISVGKVTGVLKADTSGGSIKIAGGGKSVKADTSGGSIRIGPSDGPVRADTSGGSISVEYTKGDVEVDTSGGSIRVEGSDGNVKADTSGGSITIKNVKGMIEADTSGGGIRISGAHGAIKGDTAGGNIEVELVEDNPKVNTTIDLDTAGGSITVYLPEKLKASVAAYLELNRHYSDSKIYSDFPLVINEDDGLIVAKGDINDGGDRVTLRTVNGDINIKKLAR